MISQIVAVLALASAAHAQSTSMSMPGMNMSSGMAMPTGTSNSSAANNASAALALLTATVHVQGPIEGYFNFTYTSTGVRVSGYNFSGLTNTTLGSYAYHIHTNRVANYSGNNSVEASVARCGPALAHLDPLNVTENVKCSPDFPQYCQIGDLSGKHGTLNASSAGTLPSFTYTDPFLRFFPEPFSLLGRSVVIHGFNKTRLGCGNIISVVDGTATGGNGTYVTAYPTANPPAATTLVSIAVNGSINSAGLAAFNYTLAYPAVSDANATGVFLTTSGGQNVELTTSYSYGTSLPTQGPLPAGIVGAGASPTTTSGGSARYAAGSFSAVVAGIAAMLLA